MLESEHHKRHDLRIFKSDNSELRAGDKTTGRILDEFRVIIKMSFSNCESCLMPPKVSVSVGLF